MSGAGRNSARTAYDRDGREHLHPYRPIYRSGFVHTVPQYAGWIGPDYFGYPDDAGYDDGTSYPGYAANGDYAQPNDQEPPPPFLPAPEPVQPTASTPVAENSEAITLVFKDGRASEQIHNYILSRTTLSVLDGHHHDIPVDALDLAATERANREAGVDFKLPDASR
jgi:hypothetical protein